MFVIWLAILNVIVVVVVVAAILGNVLQNVIVRFETKKFMIVISYELKQNGQANAWKGQ